MPTQTRNISFLSRTGNRIGDVLAKFLNKPRPSYNAFSLITEAQLKSTLQPGDLILVEGNSRISSAIKYLTQSTWSHVCVYIGEQEGLNPILEADLVNGVVTVPLNKYDGFNLRICRPHKLTEPDTEALLLFLQSKIGVQYDTKNIFDLMRYLLPNPPVPLRFRRRMLSFGSGDPTKAICSTLVAQAFQSIDYPILPIAFHADLFDGEDDPMTAYSAKSPLARKLDLMFRKHHTHFTPRDFDLSPYFNVIKPTLHKGFDYKKIKWNKPA
jgi:hypothetical protein